MHDAGPGPVRAVNDIQRLRLFPVVFALPASLVPALGEGYGAPCSRVMAAAAATLDAWAPEVCMHGTCGLHARAPMSWVWPGKPGIAARVRRRR